jgi:two-component system chemotaxis response regulator CheY
MRILIADDDSTSRIMLNAIVSKLGHECRVASDGTSAWEQLSSEQIDVLLTDWMMPGVDGPELCSRVRKQLGDHYVYIVLITKLADQAQILEGMSAGADDYLIKPVDPFAVKTRMIAAERVISLHRQLVDFGSQLEMANLELREQSLTDALTGLGNRRRMGEDLEHAHARAVRGGRPYGLVLFDIDHFKLYNDHYGHPAGDEVLRKVADCLRKSTRSSDYAYRYGGEELLLLLPDCTVAGAADTANRVCQAVAESAIPHEARPDAPHVVTISGGVCRWTPGNTVSPPELLRHADEALYRAKSSGRNSVQLATANHGDREADSEIARLDGGDDYAVMGTAGVEPPTSRV